jgi:hypothetical protein
MRQFSDRNGKTWQIDLCIGNVLHVRNESSGKFNLLDPTHSVGGQPLQVVLATDLGEFWEMLWLLVESQAKSQSVSAVAFGQQMAADCLVEAQQLFFDEWRDFFHSLRRPDAALAVETQAKTLAAAVKLVTARINQIDQVKLTTKIETQVETAVSAAFGKVQASLAAILDPTPGESLT